jgi:hypothetical protein
MPPQLGAAPAQIVIASFEVVEIEGQDRSPLPPEGGSYDSK